MFFELISLRVTAKTTASSNKPRCIIYLARSKQNYINNNRCISFCKTVLPCVHILKIVYDYTTAVAHLGFFLESGRESSWLSVRITRHRENNNFDCDFETQKTRTIINYEFNINYYDDSI